MTKKQQSKRPQGKRRSPSELARDRRNIAALYLKGEFQAEIGDQLGIHQSTVSRDIKWLQGEWLRLALRDFNAIKAQELAKIDNLEREYWDAWQRSCDDEETVKQEGSVTVDKDRNSVTRPEKITRTKKGKAGDPRFLEGVRWCIMQRSKILGVEAALKMELKVSDLDSAIERELALMASTGQSPAVEGT